ERHPVPRRAAGRRGRGGRAASIVAMTRRRNAARSLPAFAALIGAALLTAGCAGLPGPGGGTAGEAPAGKPSSPQPEQEAEEASAESADPGAAVAGGQPARRRPAARAA